MFTHIHNSLSLLEHTKDYKASDSVRMVFAVSCPPRSLTPVFLPTIQSLLINNSNFCMLYSTLFENMLTCLSDAPKGLAGEKIRV